MKHLLPSVFAVLALVACEEVPDTTGGGGQGGEGGGDPFAGMETLDVPVGSERVHVDLDTLALVGEGDAWDLAFEGVDVFTNSGPSGPGEGAAFPVDLVELAKDTVPPDVPFLIQDESGGPFFDWYVYDGSTHLVYSRFHVFGVRRGQELYKVQILSFYGEVEGAPVPAIYQLRSARLTQDGAEETLSHADVDGTSGGPDPDPSVPSECLRLSTGARLMLTPGEALESTEWDLCFRRDVISLNGGTSGTAGVTAVDLMIEDSAEESLDEVMERTAASELAVFEDATFADLSDSALSYRSDGVITAFTDIWIERGSDPLAPNDVAWLVAGADGETPFFVGFEAFDGSTASSVGAIKLRAKAIGGTLP
jgi:hypothetical protein